MPVFKMIKNLTDSQDPEWDLLINSTLGSDIHADRKMGFMLSRAALKCALSSLGIYTHPLKLKMTRHHLLAEYGHLTVSLSHTKNLGAALVAERKDFRSLGIDIEQEERVVKDMIRNRIAHPEDENLRNIEIWCLKEAVFKAIMNTDLFENPIEFSSIKIGKDKWTHSPSKLQGEWELEISNSVVIAKAFLKN
jgi:4'-phosphopantetheinyl transferase EntD